jgi:hypothetical protein
MPKTEKDTHVVNVSFTMWAKDDEDAKDQLWRALAFLYANHTTFVSGVEIVGWGFTYEGEEE